MKSLKTLKFILPVKSTQNYSLLISQNCNLYRNLSSLVLFNYSSLKPWFVGIYHQSFQQDSCKSPPYSTTFKLYFLALYKMNQPIFFKSLSVLSEQVHFLCTKWDKQDLAWNSKNSGMRKPSNCFIRLIDFLHKTVL